MSTTAIHDGRLVVTGDPAAGLTFTGPEGHPFGAAPLDPQLLDDATAALRQLGFPAAIARRAVLAASSHVGPDAPVMDLIRASLGALRTPRGAPPAPSARRAPPTR